MSTVLTDEVTQALLNYLGTQPYAEVAPIIAAIAQAQQPDNQNGTDPEKVENDA